MIYLPKFRRRRAKPLRPTIKEIDAAWAKFYKDKEEAGVTARAARKADRVEKPKKKGTRKRQTKGAEILIISRRKPVREKSKAKGRRDE